MMAKRPKTIVCYICGQEYGTRSLTIHLKTCKKRWAQEQDQLPKKQRRPCPPTPPGFENMIRVAQGLKPILKEGETPPVDFDKPLNKRTQEELMQEYNENAFANWNENVLEKCPNCDRTFMPRALEIHLRSCKPGKPLKPKLGAPKVEKPIKRAPVVIHQFQEIGKDPMSGGYFGDPDSFGPPGGFKKQVVAAKPKSKMLKPSPAVKVSAPKQVEEQKVQQRPKSQGGYNKQPVQNKTQNGFNKQPAQVKTQIGFNKPEEQKAATKITNDTAFPNPNKTTTQKFVQNRNAPKFQQTGKQVLTKTEILQKSKISQDHGVGTMTKNKFVSGPKQSKFVGGKNPPVANGGGMNPKTKALQDFQF